MHAGGLLGYPRRISEYGDLYGGGAGTTSLGLSMILTGVLMICVLLLDVGLSVAGVHSWSAGAAGNGLALVGGFSASSLVLPSTSSEQILRNYCVLHTFTIELSTGLVVVRG